MGENSKIEWCHHTFNPWIGCTKVSAGCTNCYAEARSNRLGDARWGDAGTRRVKAESGWREPLKWDRDARAAGERRRVFTASLADVFEDRPELVAPRDRLFGLIAATKWLDWLVLTKRPENAAHYFHRKNHWGAAEAYRDLVYGPDSGVSLGDGLSDWPPRNLWLGVSVEDQAALCRVEELAKITAAVRFVSAEPLIDRTDYSGVLGLVRDGNHWVKRADLWRTGWRPPVDWVIVGGESGPRARPCDLAWVRSVRDQCRAAATPVFVKQLGYRPFTRDPGRDSRLGINAPTWTGKRDGSEDRYGLCLHDPKGGDIDEFPADLRVREFPEPRKAVTP